MKSRVLNRVDKPDVWDLAKDLYYLLTSLMIWSLYKEFIGSETDEGEVDEVV